MSVTAEMCSLTFEFVRAYGKKKSRGLPDIVYQNFSPTKGKLLPDLADFLKISPSLEAAALWLIIAYAGRKHHHDLSVSSARRQQQNITQLTAVITVSSPFKANKLNEKLKREYFTNKIASCEGDLKSTWKTINNVLNKKSKTTNISSLNIEGKNISTNADIAESINNFFCTIGETLSDKIPSARNPLLENDYEVNPVKNKFQFHVINTLQLEKIFSKFKTSKGCGTDGIASCFLKIALPVISESLCDIFNLSLATGCFPDSWKIARVAPFLKMVNLMTDLTTVLFQFCLSWLGSSKKLFITNSTIISTKTIICFQTNLVFELSILLSLAFLTALMTGM